MKLRPYPRYEPTEIDGLVRLPNHWTVESLGRAACIRSSNVDKHIRTRETPVRLCNYVDVYYNDHLDSALEYMSGTATDDQIARLLLRQDDIVITKDSEVVDDIGVPSLVSADAPNDVVAAYHLAVLRPNAHKVIGSYLLRALQSDVTSHQFARGARGITRYALSYSTIKSVKLPCPPILEQQAIVAFLDHEVGQIDVLVARVHDLVGRLQEKRRALITETVTRGVPPEENRPRALTSSKLRPSGVAWLGNVPEHWRISSLRRVVASTDRMADVQDGKSTHRFIGMDAVESWTGRLTDSFQRSPSTAVASSSSRGFRPGDVLFGKLRPYLAKSCILNFHGLCSGEFLVLDGSERHLDNRYLRYLVLSQYVVAMTDASAYGTKMPRTNWHEVGSVLVPVPPIREQEAISSFLDEVTTRIDDLVRHAETLIDRLREKRQALITAAVTGQIDVRDEGRGATE